MLRRRIAPPPHGRETPAAHRITGHVEDAAGLPVQTELPPRPDLEELLEAAQAAGHKHEGIGKLGHLLFALVHRVADAQRGERLMADFGNRASAGE